MKVFNPLPAPIIAVFVALFIVVLYGDQKPTPVKFSITEKKAMVITADKTVPWYEFSKELERKYGQPTQSDDGHDIYTIQGKRWISAAHWNEMGSGKELVLFQLDENL